jgi:hypothetical protein
VAAVKMPRPGRRVAEPQATGIGVVALANKIVRIACKLMLAGNPDPQNPCAPPFQAKFRDWPHTSATHLQPWRADARTFKTVSRWRDRSPPHARHFEKPDGIHQSRRIVFETRIAEIILAGVHVRAHHQSGHMDASDLSVKFQNILRGEAVCICALATLHSQGGTILVVAAPPQQ